MENFVKTCMVDGSIRHIYTDGDRRYYLVSGERRYVSPPVDVTVCPACGGDPMLCECVTEHSQE